MSDQSQDAEPTMGQAVAYFGTGAVVFLWLVVVIGLSIIGFHTSADAREERLSAGAVELEASALDDGERIFGTRCASCHGATGEGGVGPSFVGVTERLPDEAEHEAIVRDGRTTMPAFGGTLSDEQIAAVVRYEREVLNNGE